MRTLRNTVAVFLIPLFVSVTAFADQAEWISKADADKAVALLKTQHRATHYCKPCRDGIVSIEEIRTVEAVRVGDANDWSVKVNGKTVDLAYVYFKTKTGKWKNVARHLKIDVSDVPTFYAWKLP